MAAAKASLLSMAQKALAPRRHYDDGTETRSAIDVTIGSDDDSDDDDNNFNMKGKASATKSHHHRDKTQAEGTTSFLSTLRSLSVWQAMRSEDGQPHKEPHKATRDRGNDTARGKGNHERQKHKHKQLTVKKNVDHATSDSEGSVSGGADENKAVERPVGRIVWAGRKKLDDVMSRFGGNSAKGERFVMKQRPELSDLAESNNDAYFQELMKSGT